MTKQSDHITEAIEHIRMASFDGPKAGSHTEWAARIRSILEDLLSRGEKG